MGLTPTANAQNVEGSYSIVAPYGADIDTSIRGTVAYTKFRSPVTELGTVSEFIETQLGVEFRGTTMMVVKWDDVAQYGGSEVSKGAAHNIPIWVPNTHKSGLNSDTYHEVLAVQ